MWCCHSTYLSQKLIPDKLLLKRHNPWGFANLSAEQFLQKRVQSIELGGEGFGFDETFRHQHILANEDQVGNHDSDRPEEHLQKVEHDESREKREVIRGNSIASPSSRV